MNNINYIKAYSNKIIINDNEVINQNINIYLNNILIHQLTTVYGRVDAIKNLYGYKKLVPIYINSQLILFPILNLKEYENIYINACNIIRITKNKSNTIIEFIGNKKIYIKKSYLQINKYYQRAISINHNS